MGLAAAPLLLPYNAKILYSIHYSRELSQFFTFKYCNESPLRYLF